MSVIVLEFLCYLCVCHSAFSLYSSGVELVNAVALLLLFLLNLLLVGRQERLKRSEMVRRLKGIITQLSGESGLSTNHWKYSKNMAFELPVQNHFFYLFSFSSSLNRLQLIFRSIDMKKFWDYILVSVVCNLASRVHILYIILLYRVNCPVIKSSCLQGN